MGMLLYMEELKRKEAEEQAKKQAEKPAEAPVEEQREVPSEPEKKTVRRASTGAKRKPQKRGAK